MKATFFLSIISLCLIQYAYAELPVTLSAPFPAIQSCYLFGSTNTITYTINNNVPRTSMPIKISGISGPVTRTTVMGDCGSTLRAGLSACNIGVQIAPTAANAGTINQNLVIDYQGRNPLTSNISFKTSLPSALWVVVAGDEPLGGRRTVPLLAQSINNGLTWATHSIIGAPALGIFKGAACGYGSQTGLCIAAGSNESTSGYLLADSNDGGNTWSIPTISGIPSIGNFGAAACAPNGANTMCFAAGNGVIAITTDSGASWTTQSITNLGQSSNAACTGNGSTALCVIGDSFGNLFQTTNGGASWSQLSIPGFSSYIINSIGCSGSGNEAICIAVNDNITDQVVLTNNGGVSWSLAASPVANNVIVVGASCTGSGVSGLCVLAGQNFLSGFPVLLQSTDGGNIWSSVSGLPSINASFFTASCTGGNGANDLCIAAGNSGLLMQTTNSGASWTTISSLGIVSDFSSSTCIGSGAIAYCDVISGGTVAQTINGGAAWSIVSIQGLPASYNFSQSGAINTSGSC